MPASTPRKDAALARLRKRTPRSLVMRQRAEHLLALEAVPTFSMPTPLYIDYADGAWMTDVDGNRFLDLAMGFGSLILGHRHSEVVAAMEMQLAKGWHTIIPGETQHDLAELLVEAVPCAEKVIFQNSGTEATMYGMRVARAYTGKDRVAVFGGAYHGTHDYALVQEDLKSPAAAPATKTVGRGVPRAVRDETILMLPYRNPAAFERIREYRDELALVIIQPVQNTTPRIDNQAYLQKLRALCDEYGILLMFDEVVTGFRLAYGGGQVYFGVTPDLAAFGKIIGGGTPVGALCGRADIMDLFGLPGSTGVFAGGTFNGNPLTMAAGAATLRVLRQRQDEIYPQLARLGEKLAGTVQAYCDSNDLAVTLMHAASIQCLHFKRGPIDSFRDCQPANRAAEEAFYVFLLDHGVLVPGVHVYFLSAAHDEVLIDSATAAFIDSLDACRADGLL
jgi:glutamate-1-semialdehyde 2,1-aminomutase